MSYALTREQLEDIRTALAVARGAASRADDATTVAMLDELLGRVRRVDGLETGALAEMAELSITFADSYKPSLSTAPENRRLFARASRLAELAKGVQFALGVAS